MTEDARNDIPQDEDQIPVPESHKAELLERYRRYKANPDQLLSLEELKERIAKWKSPSRGS
jgi:putative addiction module component (TIGR02574 family)